jgi:predicted nucleic acid-binding protein
MSVFFDTSVLVPAFTNQLPNHPVALSCFTNHTKESHTHYCSTHIMAECYATMTALPLARPISGAEALKLVQTNIAPRLNVIELDAQDYELALHLCADLGRISGQIYDALHVIAAKKAGCHRIITYNLQHFRHLAQGHIEVSTP